MPLPDPDFGAVAPLTDLI